MMARAVMGLLPAGAEWSGNIALAGVDIGTLRPRALRRLRATKLAMVFQDPAAATNPVWSCGSQLREVLRVTRGLGRKQALAEALDLLDDVGIAEPERVMAALPSQLSGGMLQRVCVAIALAAEPAVLIADEPTTALDVTTQSEVVAIFDDLRRTRELSILFITHDLELAGVVCDRIVVMYSGSLVEDQAAAGLIGRPAHPYTQALLEARPDIVSSASRDHASHPGGGPPAPRFAPDRLSRSIPAVPWRWTNAAASPAARLAPGGTVDLECVPARCRAPRRGTPTCRPLSRPPFSRLYI